MNKIIQNLMLDMFCLESFLLRRMNMVLFQAWIIQILHSISTHENECGLGLNIGTNQILLNISKSWEEIGLNFNYSLFLQPGNKFIITWKWSSIIPIRTCYSILTLLFSYDLETQVGIWIFQDSNPCQNRPSYDILAYLFRYCG